MSPNLQAKLILERWMLWLPELSSPLVWEAWVQAGVPISLHFICMTRPQVSILPLQLQLHPAPWSPGTLNCLSFCDQAHWFASQDVLPVSCLHAVSSTQTKPFPHLYLLISRFNSSITFPVKHSMMNSTRDWVNYPSLNAPKPTTFP